MANFSLTFLLSICVYLLTFQLVPNLIIENNLAFKVSLLLIGFLNFLLRPMLLILGIRAEGFPLAMFSFIINLLFLNVAAGLSDDFDLWATNASFFGAVLMAILQVILARVPLERTNPEA